MTLPNDLTPVEQQVVLDVQAKRVADLSPGVPTGGAAGLPPVRAAVVAALCVPDGAPAYTRVSIRGARITGTLDLEEQEVPCSLHVTQSVFESAVVLTSATTRTICLDGSTVPGLQADWVTVRGHVLLRNGFRSTGELKLTGASLSATLNCDGGRIVRNDSGRALTARSLKATEVRVGEGFEAFGTVSFAAADIASNVVADGGVFHAPGGVALNLERLKTGGHVLARHKRDRPVIEGTFHAYRAEIGGNVELDGALLLASGGSAIQATGLSARGAIFLRYGFEAYGEVALHSANVGTSLDCDGGCLSNPGATALAATGLAVGQKLFFSTASPRRRGGRCRVTGKLSLEQATVASDVVADGLLLSNPGQTALGLRAASIQGDLYLRDAAASGEVQLLGTKVGGRVYLVGTTIDNPSGLCLGAAGLRTGGSLWFGDRSRSDRGFAGTGGVQISRAEIGADVYCHGASFDGRASIAFDLWGSTVRGDLFFVDGFFAKGQICLMDARVGGNLTLKGATVVNPAGIAVQGERARIGGAVFVSASERPAVSWLSDIRGAIRLHSASMLSLECERCRLDNPGDRALDAFGAVVNGDVLLRRGFRAHGTVLLSNARIGGRFILRDALLRESRAGGESLLADRVSVGLGLGFHDSTVEGAVSLFSATLGGLECGNATFSSTAPQAFDATAVSVSGSLVFRKSRWAGGVKLLGARIAGAFELGESSFADGVNLRHAHAAILSDDARSWPSRRLFLDAFAYDSLGSSAVTSARQRITWVRSQGDGEYRPQVYEQLARVLRQMGLDADAREVAIAKRDAALSRGWGRVWRWPLKITIGHGYKPWRAFWCLTVMALLGWGVFEYAALQGAMTTMPGAHVNAANVFAFQPLVYAIDTLLPVVDLQQEKNWVPNLWNGLGRPVRIYLWLHTAIGWLLVTLLLGALSGLIKRE